MVIFFVVFFCLATTLAVGFLAAAEEEGLRTPPVFFLSSVFFEVFDPPETADRPVAFARARFVASPMLDGVWPAWRWALLVYSLSSAAESPEAAFTNSSNAKKKNVRE